MAECVVSETNKIVTDSSKQISDVQSCQDVKTEKVMEPLQLEDFQKDKIPITLENLIKSFEMKEVVPSKNDFLVGCIYIFMLEYGFIPIEKKNDYNDCGFCYKRIKELSSFSGWNKFKENSYSLSFTLPPHHLYVCKILCVKTGDDLIVNAFVKNIEEVQYTCMLDILTYFTDSSHADAHLSKLQNLKILSNLFKNQIAFPVKNAILHANEIRHPCFEDLPIEIILYILKYFHGIDVMRVTAVSKKFHALREDVKFWENLISRDFKYKVNQNQTCKELMKEYGRLYKLHVKHVKNRGYWRGRIPIL
ncbi:hypothetical protein WA026_016106 [Henosepilachna vigintioctopunctata]|uniref:F-box domain-containing protein n=1 Tax=Henosepilachna vigintioctopunctata TaxID=420089 RepID=A0AAW1UAX9_9CUCU